MLISLCMFICVFLHYYLRKKFFCFVKKIQILYKLILIYANIAVIKDKLLKIFHYEHLYYLMAICLSLMITIYFTFIRLFFLLLCSRADSYGNCLSCFIFISYFYYSCKHGLIAKLVFDIKKYLNMTRNF